MHCSATTAKLHKTLPTVKSVQMYIVPNSKHWWLFFANDAGKISMVRDHVQVPDILALELQRKTRVSPRESNQMASQKLRKTSNVSWKNRNQYILTRIKYALDGPFGLSKTVFLLMSNLFIFVCLGIMTRLPMTLSFWGHLATQLKNYDSVNPGMFYVSLLTDKKAEAECNRNID